MDYIQAKARVFAFLTENNYCSTIIRATKNCFDNLEAFLCNQEQDYSPGVADGWFCSVSQQYRPQYRALYQQALLRLQDCYETGDVSAGHSRNNLATYTVLSLSLKSTLDSFINDFERDHSIATASNMRLSNARFLKYIQDSGIENVSDISVDQVCQFYYDDHQNRSYYANTHSNEHVSAFLAYCYHQGILTYSHSIVVHYLSHGKDDNECFWKESSPELHSQIRQLIGCSATVSVSDLISYKNAMIKLHQEIGYSRNVINSYNKAADLLILFLETHGYRYNPEIAMAWFRTVRGRFGSSQDVVNRTLCMISEYCRLSTITLDKLYRMKPSAFSQLPEWCRNAADTYIDIKQNEGWAKSTLDMIRSSITRFCVYLDSVGLRSFRDLTAEHIKQFNSWDNHKTPQGKNAYNVRIRKFLIYLGGEGMLKNPMLFVALTKVSAPKESIVVVLTDSEMKELEVAVNDENGSLSLRKKAMLLFGLKMGLRSCDVANLRIDDVSWDHSSIRFIQQKTEVEVDLPMPTEVGNALFRYIVEERCQKRPTRNIFLSERAPHKPVGRVACQRALNSALPDRKAEGSGFHVLRKTYATGLLRKGVSASMVAEALGQRGTDSVHRYLSLDVDRMRMCAISLTEFGLEG